MARLKLLFCIALLLAGAGVAAWGGEPLSAVPTTCSTVKGPAVPVGKPVADPREAPTAVLWDQPLSTVNQNAYVDQEFTDYPEYSSYLLDDFTVSGQWNVTTLFIPGSGWNGFTSLLNANALVFSIYADAAGVPAGYPGGGAAPVWTLSVAPTDPQVALTTGVNGYTSDVTLTLTTPVTLTSGTYWLAYYPVLSFTSYGQFGRHPADTAQGATAQFINPGGGFGYGTGYQNWSILSVTQTDLAFRVEGDLCSDQTFENGPLVTHPGGGAGGADASVLQSALSLTTYGFGVSLATGYRIADDFTIEDSAGWDISGIEVYAYQTGSTTTSTITSVNYRIWDGPPNDPASTVVFGDTTTNQLVSTTWSNIYRVLDTDMAGSSRPIMGATLSCGTHLPPGTYWLDWQVGGSLSSGPWAPPISILNQTTTGNGMQYGGSAWTSVVDSGTATPQGFPFDITYSLCGSTCPTITLSPATLPGGSQGAAYSQVISASGGTAPYAFAVTAGALPPGLGLAADGTLSGTPTGGGTFTFTVTATDAASCTGALEYTLEISSCPAITLSPATLPGGVVGSPYSATLTATGGTGPYTFAVTSGALPPGLTLTAAGVLSGTFSSAGSYTFTVTATDSLGCTGSITYTVDTAAFDLSFYDDAGATQLCINRNTATWSFTIFSGEGAGTYTGTCTFSAAPAGLTRMTGTGNGNSINALYSLVRHTARVNAVVASLTPEVGKPRILYKANLFDSNTLDSPACGSVPTR